MNQLVVVGCGGFGREVMDIVNAVNQSCEPTWHVKGFVDDNPTHANKQLAERAGFAYLGTTQVLNDEWGLHLALAIGDNRIRAALAERWTGRHTLATLVHPRAYVGSSTTLGAGTIVAAGAHITTNVTTGRAVHIDALATIAHDCIIDDYARANPQACVSGAVHVGSKALIGANATILQNLTVGADATVGAGACVTRDVSPGQVVKGVPAR